ncbi:putative RNA methyltransferase [Pseudomonadota bacterium]
MVRFQKLSCPLCEQAFIGVDSPLRCANGHSFDIARQGYVNLLPVQHKKSKEPGDSKEMVNARQRFLDSGVYQSIADLFVKNVLTHMSDAAACSLLDAGCGEGYYLNALARQLGQGQQREVALIGLDISKPAIIAAAKRNKAITWLVGSNKQLPVLPASLDMIVCMFGFPVYEAFKTALKPGGKILFVEAGADHLIELRKVIYPQIREHSLPSLAAAEQQGFGLISRDTLRMGGHVLNQQQLSDLLVMTPHLYRASKEGKEAVQKLTELRITIDIVVRVLQLKD